MKKISLVKFSLEEPKKQRNDNELVHVVSDYNLALELGKRQLRQLDDEGDIPFNIFADDERTKYIKNFDRNEADGSYKFAANIDTDAADLRESDICIKSPRVTIWIEITEKEIETPEDWQELYTSILK